jgi:hypothetical protein
MAKSRQGSPPAGEWRALASARACAVPLKLQAAPIYLAQRREDKKKGWPVVIPKTPTRHPGLVSPAVTDVRGS